MPGLLDRYEELQREQQRWHELLVRTDHVTELEKMTGAVDEARVARNRRARQELQRIARELEEIKHKLQLAG